MALWWFVECGRCGYSGCAAPIGERCPSCGIPLETDGGTTPVEPT